MKNPLTDQELKLMDAFWRACNYLSIGMIYLRANPLLREPLKPEHVKIRLLGHWGTSPELSFVWAHLNRLVVQRGQDVLLMIGPGHGGPAGARPHLRDAAGGFVLGGHHPARRLDARTHHRAGQPAR